MKNKKTIVEVKISIEGYHNYPNAPKKVDFLSHKHRHTFEITSGYKVSDLNREKEIFICRDEVESYLYETYGNPCQFGEMSCEMIATEILEFAEIDGMVWCRVWEEQTGGAKVELE